MRGLLREFSKRQDFSAIVSVVALFVIFSILDPSGWLSWQTLGNVLHFTAILGLLAIGEAMVIISKEIDLSVGSIYGLVGVAFIIFETSFGVVGAFIAAMALALFLGWLNAFFILRGKIPSMIVTLATLFSYRGVIYVWTGGTTRSFPQEARDHWLTRIFGGEILSFENAIFWFVVVVLVLNTVLHRMRTGNHLLAVGGDAKSALSQGVNVIRTKTKAFMIASGLAGFSGIITLCDKSQTHVTMGQYMELEAIASAVIGGCLLSGGRGSLIGAALGAFIITSVRYQLIALGAPSSWFITFVGIVLILAVIFNQTLSRALRYSSR